MAENTFPTDRSTVMYLPTIKACEEYKLSRTPLKYDTNNAVVPDFLSGEQYQRTKYVGQTLTNLDVEEKKNLLGSNVMDEVILEVLNNKPYSSTTSEKININGVDHYQEVYVGDPETVFKTIRIAPNWDSIDRSVSHQWGKPQGLLSQVMDQVNSLLGVMDDVITTVKNATSAGNKTPDYSPKMVKQVDIRNQYQGTDKEEIEIPFTLFTKSDFVSDIFYPIMFLTALSYPVRLSLPELERQFKQKLALNTINSVEDENGQKPPAPGDDSSVEQFLKNIFSGYRIDVSVPPPYIRVSHSSNLFKFDHAVITELNYTFKKPYYNVKGILGSQNLQPRAYPLSADCVLKLKCMDHHLNDYYLRMIGNMRNYVNGNEGTVQVITSEETPPSVNPTSNAQRRKEEVEYNRQVYAQAAAAAYRERLRSEPTESAMDFCMDYGSKNHNQDAYNSVGASQRACEDAVFNDNKTAYCNNYDYSGSDNDEKRESCLTSPRRSSVPYQSTDTYADGVSYSSDQFGAIEPRSTYRTLMNDKQIPEER